MIRKATSLSLILFSFPNDESGDFSGDELAEAEGIISKFEQRNKLGSRRAPKLIVFKKSRSISEQRLRALASNRRNISTIFVFHFGYKTQNREGFLIRQGKNPNTHLRESIFKSISNDTGVNFVLFTLNRSNQEHSKTIGFNSFNYEIIKKPVKLVRNFETLMRVKPFFSNWDFIVFCCGWKTEYLENEDTELFHSIVPRRRLWDKDIEQFSSSHQGSREDGIDTLYQFLTDVENADEAVEIARYFHHADPVQSVRSAAARLLDKRTNVEVSSPRILHRNFQSFDFLNHLVTVPTGPFMMGSVKQLDEYSLEEEQPLHRVELDEFKISRLQVRVRDYTDYLNEVVGEAEALIQAEVRSLDAPITKVSWYDAINFCRWATIRGREANLLDADTEIRLPTEAEWEKAAKGPNGSVFPWGDKFDKNACNYRLSEPNEVVPVGTFSPVGDSGYGVSDMAGNAWDWTLSLWGRRFNLPDYCYPYEQEDGRENVLAGKEYRRIIRGGGYYYHSYCLRTSTRNAAFPNFTHSGGSFRIVVSSRLLIEKPNLSMSHER